MSPSAFHEILVDLIRECPALVLDLLRPLLGRAMPAGTAVLGDASFTQIAPAEFAADLVVIVGEPVALGVVVEVQLRRDEDKRYSWPLYAAALRARRRCQTAVLVLAPNPAVASWAAEPIWLGPENNLFRPLVVGPGGIPWVTSAEAARAAPELTVLSAIAHGDEPAGDAVLDAMLAGLLALSDDRARLYYDLVVSQVGDAARRALEVAMTQRKYEYQSDFARKYYGEGLTAGQTQGRVEGAKLIVLRMLARRFGMPGEDLRTRIESLDVESLEALSDALFDFQTSDDLQRWLDANP